MLVITDEARDAIRAIIEESDIGPAGGLRIFGTDDIRVRARGRAGEGDGVIREGGVVVFLDPPRPSCSTTRSSTPHAHGDHVHFSLDEQKTASS